MITSIDALGEIMIPNEENCPPSAKAAGQLAGGLAGLAVDAVLLGLYAINPLLAVGAVAAAGDFKLETDDEVDGGCFSTNFATVKVTVCPATANVTGMLLMRMLPTVTLMKFPRIDTGPK